MNDNRLDEILDAYQMHKQSPSVRRLCKSELNQLIKEKEVEQLDRLKTELREYREKYPDADYNDVMGYIAGFQHRPTLQQQLKGKGR